MLVNAAFLAALRDAEVILGWLTPGLPLRCASGSPGAKFLSSLRDAFAAPAVRRAVPWVMNGGAWKPPMVHQLRPHSFFKKCLSEPSTN